MQRCRSALSALGSEAKRGGQRQWIPSAAAGAHGRPAAKQAAALKRAAHVPSHAAAPAPGNRATARRRLSWLGKQARWAGRIPKTLQPCHSRWAGFRPVKGQGNCAQKLGGGGRARLPGRRSARPSAWASLPARWPDHHSSTPPRRLSCPEITSPTTRARSRPAGAGPGAATDAGRAGAALKRWAQLPLTQASSAALVQRCFNGRAPSPPRSLAPPPLGVP